LCLWGKIHNPIFIHGCNIASKAAPQLLLFSKGGYLEVNHVNLPALAFTLPTAPAPLAIASVAGAFLHSLSISQKTATDILVAYLTFKIMMEEI
jgi:hypothetical protein